MGQGGGSTGGTSGLPTDCCYTSTTTYSNCSVQWPASLCDGLAHPSGSCVCASPCNIDPLNLSQTVTVAGSYTATTQTEILADCGCFEACSDTWNAAQTAYSQATSTYTSCVQACASAKAACGATTDCNSAYSACTASCMDAYTQAAQSYSGASSAYTSCVSSC